MQDFSETKNLQQLNFKVCEKGNVIERKRNGEKVRKKIIETDN
jgi:hypothetical protein